MDQRSFARAVRYHEFGGHGRAARQREAAVSLSSALPRDATDPNWWRGEDGQRRIEAADELQPLTVLLAICKARDVPEEQVEALQKCGWISIEMVGPQKLFRATEFEFIEPDRHGDTLMYQRLRYWRRRRVRRAVTAKIQEFGIARQMNRMDRYEARIASMPKSYVSPE